MMHGQKNIKFRDLVFVFFNNLTLLYKPRL